MARNTTYAVILYIILFSIALVSLYVILFETKLLLKQPEDNVTRVIRVHQIVGEGTGEGYILLKRNPNTPSTMDWASIDDKSVAYFTIAEMQKVEKEVIIKIPEGVMSGRYYIDYQLTLGDETWLKTMTLRVS